MNAYEINILFKTDEDAELILKCYESLLESTDNSLENVIPKLFNAPQFSKTKNFNIDSFKRKTNEILIYCYGTKFPSIEICDLFSGLKIDKEYGIKLKSCYDGDGGNEYYCIVNGAACSIQKYTAFYRKNKTPDTAVKKKKALKKKQPTDKEKKVASHQANSKNDEKELLESLNYGRHRSCQTALIRMSVRSKAKRETIRELFEQHTRTKSNDSLRNFSSAFNSLVNSVDYDVRWCEIKGKRRDVWLKAPEKLICALKFVVELKNYLYLGFDLENLNLHEDRNIDTDLRHLVLIFDSIDGVNKTWIKYRPGKNTIKERYVYSSEPGSQPHVVVNNLTEDSQW